MITKAVILPNGKVTTTKCFKSPEIVDQQVVAKDAAWRELTQQKGKLHQGVNLLQKTVISPKKKAKVPCKNKVAEMKAIQPQIKEIKAKILRLEEERG